MTEQYCLRWNNHQSTVISVFENLLESGSLIDCTLCADGKLLKAHKVVLSACSSVFESMLCQQGGDKHPIIFLKDVRFEEMKAMLDYMYKGEANVHQELLDSFLKTAASLQIKGLTDQGGGGGTDEPPPKKGPGVNANRKAPPPLDATPESSREGSISPTMSRKRRRPTNNMAGVRRPSSEDASADNSCDTIPMSSAQNVSNQQYQAAPPVASQPPSLPMPQPSQSMETARVTIKKQEPLDQTPQSMIQPKTEFIDESNEDVEDLTLDDDDDYNDSMSEMSKPGTSYSMQQPSQDFQWSQMMGGNDSRSGADESFMQQDSVNNQGNTQDQILPNEKDKHSCEKELNDTEINLPQIQSVVTLVEKPREEDISPLGEVEENSPEGYEDKHDVLPVALECQVNETVVVAPCPQTPAETPDASECPLTAGNGDLMACKEEIADLMVSREQTGDSMVFREQTGDSIVLRGETVDSMGPRKETDDSVVHREETSDTLETAKEETSDTLETAKEETTSNTPEEKTAPSEVPKKEEVSLNSFETPKEEPTDVLDGSVPMDITPDPGLNDDATTVDTLLDDVKEETNFGWKFSKNIVATALEDLIVEAKTCGAQDCSVVNPKSSLQKTSSHKTNTLKPGSNSDKPVEFMTCPKCKKSFPGAEAINDHWGKTSCGVLGPDDEGSTSSTSPEESTSEYCPEESSPVLPDSPSENEDDAVSIVSISSDSDGPHYPEKGARKAAKKRKLTRVTTRCPKCRKLFNRDHLDRHMTWSYTCGSERGK